MVFRKESFSLASSKFNPSAGSVKHFSDQANSLPVAILGMRCFGQALSGKLVVDGIEVLCVDHREKVIQELLSALGHMVTTDTITLEVLKQLGADKAEHVVIAIDSDTGASLLTASVLADMGVPLIRAKANNRTHAKILNQIGVHHTIRPGADISHRIAHLIGSKIQDFLEFDYDYAVGKATPPVHCPDKTVAGIN